MTADHTRLTAEHHIQTVGEILRRSINHRQ